MPQSGLYCCGSNVLGDVGANLGYLSSPPDIEAEVRFLSTEEGGRQGPCKSGYRGCHDFGIKEGLNDAVHQYLGKEWVEPGETVTAQMWLLAPEMQVGRLFEGFEFTVHEGAKIVGHGRINKVFNKDLVATDFKTNPM